MSVIFSLSGKHFYLSPPRLHAGRGAARGMAGDRPESLKRYEIHAKGAKENRYEDTCVESQFRRFDSLDSPNPGSAPGIGCHALTHSRRSWLPFSYIPLTLPKASGVAQKLETWGYAGFSLLAYSPGFQFALV